MRSDTRAFLRHSQQRVIEGYHRVIATWPDMPAKERAAIVARIRAAEDQLAAFEADSRAITRVAAE